jgi:large subunit ribosomal protein L3
MVHAIIRDNYQFSPNYGKEVFRALTVLEAPPVILAGLRFYSIGDNKVMKAIGEVWSKNLPKELERTISLPKKESLFKIDSLRDRVFTVRALIVTQPWKTGLPKKKPEIIEIPLGGSVDSQLNQIGSLGSEINIKDIFTAPQIVDVISVSRGKGYEGPVARFGIKIIQKKKAKKTKRGPGSDSPMTPGAVMSSVPRAGQHGFHNRVDLNKLIVDVVMDPLRIVPPSGFRHYGVPRSPLVLLQGSVPGAAKRLVILRSPVRNYFKPLKEAPPIEYISTQQKVA